MDTKGGVPDQEMFMLKLSANEGTQAFVVQVL
jgi:hypothetical protein